MAKKRRHRSVRHSAPAHEDYVPEDENMDEHDEENHDEGQKTDTTITWLGPDEETEWNGVTFTKGEPVALSEFPEEMRSSVLAQARANSDHFQIDEKKEGA